MGRLLRPHIPYETRCRVALGQLGEMFVDEAIEIRRPDRAAGYMVGVVGLLGGGFQAYLAELLADLADLLGCKPEDLRLDHHPALATREKVMRFGKHIGYRPAANDPEYLMYREKNAHHIKTNVRGDGAQHPDRVLIKKERRREKAALQQKRGIEAKSQRRLPSVSGAKVRPQKQKWPKRPLRSGNKWPRKGRS